MFIQVLLRLSHARRRPMGITECEFAHAALQALINQLNPELGAWLHAQQRDKPVALALLDGRPDSVWLRLTFHGVKGSELWQALSDRIASDTLLSLHIGTTECEVEPISAVVARGAVLRRTWNDFQSDIAYRSMRFEFLTPTAIMKSIQSKQRFAALLPDPVDLFSSLSRRWMILGGPQLQSDLLEFVQTGGCVVSCIQRLETQRYRTTERTQIGWVGAVTYECLRSSDAHIRALNTLARMADFTGIGYQTTRGMGAVRVSLLP